MMIAIHISVYSPITILGNASSFELLPSLKGPIEVQRGQNVQTPLKLAISMEYRSLVLRHCYSDGKAASNLMSQ